MTPTLLTDLISEQRVLILNLCTFFGTPGSLIHAKFIWSFLWLLNWRLFRLVKGQLQRFDKLSLFDRFRHVENGFDINYMLCKITQI